MSNMLGGDVRGFGKKLFISKQGKETLNREKQ